jgi:hypothetical protein
MDVVRTTIKAREVLFAYATTGQRLAANLRAIRVSDLRALGIPACARMLIPL